MGHGQLSEKTVSALKKLLDLTVVPNGYSCYLSAARRRRGWFFLLLDLGPGAFGKRVSRRGREKRDSEEVWLHNFVYMGGGRPRHEDTVETLFPVIFLGRAAKNNVGPEGRVHDMRTMWSPYDQSCNLGGPADPLAQLFYRRVRPDYMTGHRGSTLSSCRGHDPLAQHYFRRLCPEI